MLPCKHRFHLECIDQWLSARKPLCPICKWDALQPFTPLNADQEEGAAEPAATTAPFLFFTRRCDRHTLRLTWPDVLFCKHANMVHLQYCWEQRRHLMKPAVGRIVPFTCMEWQEAMRPCVVVAGGDGLGAGPEPSQRQQILATVARRGMLVRLRLRHRPWSAPAAAGRAASPQHPPTSQACTLCAAAMTPPRCGFSVDLNCS